MRSWPFNPGLTALYLLFLPGIAIAQSKIYGIVVDKSQRAVANANVLLLSLPDSALTKGLISSENGSFAFENVSKGKYIISSTFTGLTQVYTSPLHISETAGDIDLGTITLQENVSSLNAVTITGRKPLFQQLIDRTVINVENSITAAGSTALDVLMRSPGIMIDHYNQNISMNGKNGVVIMINGKPNYMPASAIVQMLSSMPSSNIEKIELITTPPANFDAEGNAGYINIVLKTNENYGTNGSYSLMAGYGKGALASPSINFNHRQGKINIYGDGSYSLEKVYPAYITLSRHATNNGNLVETFSDTYRDVTESNTNARLGIDAQLDKRNVAGVLFTVYERLYKMHAWNTNTVSTNRQLDSSMRIFNTEVNRWRSYSANTNLQHNFRDDASLTFNFDYIIYKNTQPVEYDNSRFDKSGTFTYSDQTRSDKVTPIHIYVSAADFNKKISAKISVETGLKFTFSDFSNDIGYSTLINNVWLRDPAQSGVYKLRENYSAGYATFNLSIDKSTDLKAGGRYEYTNSNLGSETSKDIVDRHYGNFFPSIFVTHKINDNNTVNISYSKRITRPTFNDLAPFTYFADPNTLFTGNPALQPAYSHIFKADYTLKSYFLSVSFTKENASIQGFQPRTDSVNNKQILSAENIVNKKTLNTSLTVPVTVNSWWNMQLNLMGTWQQANAVIDQKPYHINKFTYGLNGSQRFTISPTWSGEISGFFQSADVFGIFVQKPMSSVDVGIKKKLSGNKGSLQFAVTNVLKTMRFHMKADVPDHNIYTDLDLDTFFRGYRVTYTQNFGKEKLRGKRERSTGSEEERGRVR